MCIRDRSNAATFCAGVGLPLSFTSIPDVAENGNMLSFDTANMKRIFDEGVTLAQGPGLWVLSLIHISEPTRPY